MEYLSYSTHLPMAEPKTGVRIEPKLNWARIQEITIGDKVKKKKKLSRNEQKSRRQRSG